MITKDEDDKYLYSLIVVGVSAVGNLAVILLSFGKFNTQNITE